MFLDQFFATHPHPHQPPVMTQSLCQGQVLTALSYVKIFESPQSRESGLLAFCTAAPRVIRPISAFNFTPISNTHFIQHVVYTFQPLGSHPAGSTLSHSFNYIRNTAHPAGWTLPHSSHHVYCSPRRVNTFPIAAHPAGSSFSHSSHQ